MIVTFTVDTPMLHDAREQAVRLAQAQGYKRVTVLSILKVGSGGQWDFKGYYAHNLEFCTLTWELRGSGSGPNTILAIFCF